MTARRRIRYRANGGTRNAAAGVAVAAIVIGAAGHPGAAARAASEAGAGLSTTRPDIRLSGTLGCAGLESLWEAAGGPASAARTAASVAMAESGGRQYARLADPDGTEDRGYFQVNSRWGALSTYAPLGNARSAVAISRGGTDWTPWTTYNSGAYVGKC